MNLGFQSVQSIPLSALTGGNRYHHASRHRRGTPAPPCSNISKTISSQDAERSMLILYAGAVGQST